MNHAENRRLFTLAKRERKYKEALSKPRYYRCWFTDNTIWRVLGGRMMCSSLVLGRNWIEACSSVRAMDYRCDSKGRFLHGLRARKVGTRRS